MTRPAELASFNVEHSDDAIMHKVAIMHEPHPRDTLKDLTLAGHVITITNSPLLCCWQDLHATLNVIKCV